jgi:hypothetical protein
MVRLGEGAGARMKFSSLAMWQLLLA